jgi:putative transposase
VLRINIVLGAAAGIANHVLARELSTSLPTVLLWRRRYESDGLAGVIEDKHRSGRPKQIPADKEMTIVEATIKTTPKDATHWSVRSMAASQRVSPATVQRIWKKHKLQPHRVESFKFSTDLDFAPKVRDIVGLYMNHLIARSCSAWTRRVRSKPWTGRSRFFPYGPDCRRDRRTTTSAMGRPRSLPP